MTLRRLLAGLLGVVLAVAPWNVAARVEGPRWHAQSWCLAVPCERGYVAARVWFDEDEQCYQWSALRTGEHLPRGPQWRNGACKMAAEAKQAAEAAIEEVSR